MERPITLTPREKIIMELIILEGMESHVDIGQALCISPKTVKNHFGNIYRKLGVTSRSGAVVKTLTLGLVELPYVAQMRKDLRAYDYALKHVRDNGTLPSDFDRYMAST